MNEDGYDKDRDIFENFYRLFISTLYILSEYPLKQCTGMGNYNVAWELRDDGLSVDYLINQRIVQFTNEQIAKMTELSRALHALSNEAYRVRGLTREENLIAMNNPEWEQIRNIAKKLIQVLEPRTSENISYFKNNY